MNIFELLQLLIADAMYQHGSKDNQIKFIILGEKEYIEFFNEIRKGDLDDLMKAGITMKEVPAFERQSALVHVEESGILPVTKRTKQAFFQGYKIYESKAESCLIAVFDGFMFELPEIALEIVSDKPIRSKIDESNNEKLAVGDVLHYQYSKNPPIIQGFPHKKQAWLDDYKDSYSWKYFDANFCWCERCKSFQEGICICYAR